MAEALLLADELDDVHTTHVARNAAAELRRLHAENERLHQINQSHEVKLSVRGYEIQIADLEAQRDALLEALKGVEDRCTSSGYVGQDGQYLKSIRAAISKTEGEQI